MGQQYLQISRIGLPEFVQIGKNDESTFEKFAPEAEEFFDYFEKGVGGVRWCLILTASSRVGVVVGEVVWRCRRRRPRFRCYEKGVWKDAGSGWRDDGVHLQVLRDGQR